MRSTSTLRAGGVRLAAVGILKSAAGFAVYREVRECRANVRSIVLRSNQRRRYQSFVAFCKHGGKLRLWI